MDHEIEEFLDKEKRVVIESFRVKADNYLSHHYADNIYDHFDLIEIAGDKRVRFQVKFDYVNRDYILPGNMFTGFEWVDILVLAGVHQEILTKNFLKGLKNLKVLAFLNSEVRHFEPGFFMYTPKLEDISFNFLGLESLPSDIINLPNIKIIQLKGDFDSANEFHKLKSDYTDSNISEFKHEIKEIYKSRKEIG